jgi:hypothetical protein
MTAPKDGTFYACKTLLACEPDTNTRHVYRWPSDKVILTMNPYRRVWTEEDSSILDFILDRLNKEYY